MKQIKTNHEDLHKASKDLKRERELAVQQIYNLNARVREIDAELMRISCHIETKELSVTDHAVERFKQRVVDMPTKSIRKMLTSDHLLRLHQKHGEGRYGIQDMPHIVAVIKDFTVITIINTEDPEESLQALSPYMDYFIDELILKHSGEKVKVMPFRKFKRLYFRQQSKEKTLV